MTNQVTLFSRYKHMINLMWADGQRKYTANELNTFVGQYEALTGWKIHNNNRYYTTRTYQTALKQLGCITPIKRGLWQINAPIPEWFGSFHMSAFNSKSALAELERSSIYWQSLPAKHKVNPWKNIDPMRVMASIQQPLETTVNKNHKPMTTTIDCTLVTVSDVVFTTKFPLLTGTFQVSINTAVNGSLDTEVCDWEYFLDGKSIGISTAGDLFRVYGETLDSALETGKKIAAQQALDSMSYRDAVAAADNEADNAGFTKDGARYYSEAEVEQILLAFISSVGEDVATAVIDAVDSLDESDAVNIDLGYDFRTLDVSLDSRVISREVVSAVKGALCDANNEFCIDSVKVK